MSGERRCGEEDVGWDELEQAGPYSQVRHRLMIDIDESLEDADWR